MARNPARPRVVATVDIGSFSVHLLVADVRARGVEARHDESAHLGLGRAIDATGGIGEAMGPLIETLSAYARRARSMGASTITVVATDPLRRAADAVDVISGIEAATGLEVAVLGHEEEALVALVGVQGGRAMARDTAIVDVGGGSTEVLAVGPSREPEAAGLPLGATRLTGMHVRHDPPTSGELAALLGHALTEMAKAPEFTPVELVAVGGTARSLLRVGPRLANRSLTRRRIRRAIELMAAAPAEVTAERFGVRASRATVLVAGASILLGAIDRYRLPRLRVAAGGLREGVALASWYAGPAWRSEITTLARGWDR